jgi:hypothetical protein
MVVKNLDIGTDLCILMWLCLLNKTFLLLIFKFNSKCVIHSSLQETNIDVYTPIETI